MDAENVTPEMDMAAYVELFGHQTFAARVVSAPCGPAMFLRCDVFDGKGGVAFSRLVNPTAVYSLTPVDAETGQRIMAQRGGPSAPIPYIALPPAREEMEDDDD